LFPRKGKPKLISLKSQNDPINAFQAEITSAVTAIKAGEVKGPLDAQLARDALVLCLKEIESVLCAKPVIVSKNG
jgi:hypothetical protein